MSNKWILIILNLIIITLIGVAAINGLKLTNDKEVLSVRQTMDLDVDYQVVMDNYNQTVNLHEKALQEQKTAIKAFENSEKKFEEVKNLNSYETLVELAAKREYNVESLWIKLGLIAESNDLVHAFHVARASNTQNYNINVELTGSYSGIRNFIEDIMMDMDLMFKAEDIVIEKTDKDLKATFIIKNVNVVM